MSLTEVQSSDIVLDQILLVLDNEEFISLEARRALKAGSSLQVNARQRKEVIERGLLG
jgi:hypothetical protein